MLLPFFLFWGQLKTYFQLKWTILKRKITIEENCKYWNFNNVTVNLLVCSKFFFTLCLHVMMLSLDLLISVIIYVLFSLKSYVSYLHWVYLCHYLSNISPTITPPCKKQHSLVKKVCLVGNQDSYLNIDFALPRIFFVPTNKYLTTYWFVKQQPIRY